MAQRYWVGGTGTWTDTAHWSASNGGSSGASVPVTADDANITSSSGFGSGGTISIGASVELNSLISTTGHTYTIDASYDTLDINSQLTLESTVTLSDVYINLDNGGTVYFNTNNANIKGSLFVGASTTLHLQSDFRITLDNSASEGTIAIDGGSTFYSNNYSVKTRAIAIIASTIYMGSSNFTLDGEYWEGYYSGNWYAETSSTINAGTSTLIFTHSTAYQEMIGAGKTYYNLWVHGNKDLGIYDSNTFNEIKADSDVDFLYFESKTTQTVTSWVVNGTISHDIQLGTFSSAYAGGTVANNTYSSLYSGSIVRAGQSFTGDGSYIIRLSNINLRKTGSPTGSVYAKIYAHSGTFGSSSVGTGAVLATSDALDVSTITSSSDDYYYVFDFTGANKIFLTNATNYVFTIEYSGGSASDYLQVKYCSTGGNSGNYMTYTGSTWTAVSGSDIGRFYVSGVAESYLSKSSGILESEYLEIYNSYAVGGATWNAYESIDGMDEVANSGWNFLSGIRKDISKSVNYSVSNTADITKTSKYTTIEDFNIQKTSDYDVGRIFTVSLNSIYEVTGQTIQKKYMYKVYSPAGTYLDTWTNDVSDFQIREELNTAGSVITVKLPRPADDFGEGSSVDYANRVEVYVIDKEAPNGLLRFTGFITSYESDYSEESVTVTISSYGAELQYHIMHSGSDTTVTYSSQDPSVILKAILDTYNTDGGEITYDAGSIDTTGTTVSYTFNTNTVKEGIDKVLELAPENWYYYIDQATNLLHFHELATAPAHTISIGKNIKNIKIKKDLEKVINTVYFSGGGSPVLYKKYTIPASITAYGIRGARYKDGRVTVTDTALKLSNKLLRGDPEILVTLSLVDSNLNDLGYDLESIALGETIKIGSSGIGPSSQYDVGTYDASPFDYDLSNLSSIIFQITTMAFTGDELEFTLATTPPDITKRIQDINRNLLDIQNNDNPTAPS